MRLGRVLSDSTLPPPFWEWGVSKVQAFVIEALDQADLARRQTGPEESAPSGGEPAGVTTETKGQPPEGVPAAAQAEQVEEDKEDQEVAGQDIESPEDIEKLRALKGQSLPESEKAEKEHKEKESRKRRETSEKGAAVTEKKKKKKDKSRSRRRRGRSKSEGGRKRRRRSGSSRSRRRLRDTREPSRKRRSCKQQSGEEEAEFCETAEEETLEEDVESGEERGKEKKVRPVSRSRSPVLRPHLSNLQPKAAPSWPPRSYNTGSWWGSLNYFYPRGRSPEQKSKGVKKRVRQRDIRQAGGLANWHAAKARPAPRR